jgi:hypothetical protein
MARSVEDDPAPAGGGRKFRVLSVGAGVVLGSLVVALATQDMGASAEPSSIDSLPAVQPGGTEPASAVAQHQAPRLDEGVDWQRVEVWAEFATAAIAAYEH